VKRSQKFLTQLVSGIKHRPLQWLIYLIFVVFFLRADPTAGVIFIVTTLVVRYLLTRRSVPAFRRSVAFLLVIVGVIGILSALALPSYRAATNQMLIPAKSIRDGEYSSSVGSFELTYDLMTTSPDAQQVIDNQARYLSGLGMDGVFLNPDGSLQAADNTTLLLHTHLADTRGMFLVQNYDNGSFDSKSAHRVLTNAHLRLKLAKSIEQLAVTQHWDGVIMDFESLYPADFPIYADFIKQLKSELPSAMTLGVDLAAVPAHPSPTYVAAVTGLGRAASYINLMSYDLHVSAGSPGPIAPLDWVRAQVAAAKKYISPLKLKLGAADYADVWGPLVKRTGAVLTPATALAYAKANGLALNWDSAVGEWHATAKDGSQMWISDRTSIQARIALARQLGLRGLNVWELSRTQSLSGLTHGVTIYRPYVSANFNRPVKLLNAKGLVALTFDDGPDPAWTPRVLTVLERLHVPATFFVIGQQAVDHPDLVARAIRDGDVIGNHTFTHPDLAAEPQWLARSEINAGSWVIKGITGRNPLLFRSPYGITDNLTAARGAASSDIVQTMGLSEIGWNTDTLDWSRPGVSRIVKNAEAAPNAEPIILMHDGGGNRWQTVHAIAQVVRHYRAMGYQFTTVDHLDGGVQFPYQVRANTFWNIADSLLAIAGFKLWLASREIISTILILMAAISILRLSLGWLLAEHYLRRLGRLPAAASEPKISILVPAHNEQETIVKTLTSLNDVTWSNLEILVAENGSNDLTLARARAFAAEHGRVKVIECAARGKAAALNEVFPESTGDLVVVLDADTVISKNFCDSIVAHFEDPSVGAVAGNVKVGNRRNLLTRLQALEYLISLTLDRASQSQVGIVSVVPGAAGAFRRTAIEQVGGWPERTLVEDTDLTIALHRAGWKITYEPRAVSLTEVPETVPEVVKQRSRWIYGTSQVVSVNFETVLSLRAGRLGVVGLPWLLLTQILLPVLGPLVDLYMLSQVVLGQSMIALWALLLSLGLEAAVTIWALLRSGESLRLLPGVLGLRLVWRPLMLWVALVSMFKFVRGRAVSWRKLVRRNSVEVPAAKA